MDGDGQVPPEATQSGGEQPLCPGGGGGLCLIIWRASAFARRRRLTLRFGRLSSDWSRGRQCDPELWTNRLAGFSWAERREEVKKSPTVAF